MYEERIRVFEHNGYRILLHDYSNLTGDSMMLVLREAAAGVTHRGKGLNILTDVRGTFATRETVDALKKLAHSATPFVRKSAVVGVTRMQRILLDAIRAVTGRQIRAFDTFEEARDWLAG